MSGYKSHSFNWLNEGKDYRNQHRHAWRRTPLGLSQELLNVLSGRLMAAAFHSNSVEIRDVAPDRFGRSRGLDGRQGLVLSPNEADPPLPRRLLTCRNL